jgi:Flp pilus assembly CpaF family ATPase
LNRDRETPALPNLVALRAREQRSKAMPPPRWSARYRDAPWMDPDRIILGEVRGDDVPMRHASSPGNDCSLATIDASTSARVFRRLALDAAKSTQRLDQTTTNLHIGEGLDLVVQLGRRGKVSSNEILRPRPGRA